MLKDHDGPGGKYWKPEMRKQVGEEDALLFLGDNGGINSELLQKLADASSLKSTPDDDLYNLETLERLTVELMIGCLPGLCLLFAGWAGCIARGRGVTLRRGASLGDLGETGAATEALKELRPRRAFSHQDRGTVC